ncbi:hypothetical protein IWW38_003976, partial [Coemansia aciculifera]
MNYRATRVILLVCSVLAFVGIFRGLQYVNQPSHDMEGPWTGSHDKTVASPDYTASSNTTASDEDDKTLLRAAMVALVRNSELDGIRSTMRQVEDRFNREFGYPYIFLNDEDFTDEFKDRVRAMT